VANEVLQIPLSRHGVDVFLCWPHRCFGLDMVRYAYHLECLELAAVSHSARDHGISSNTQAGTKFWKGLW
jgi:hypothetical protein